MKGVAIVQIKKEEYENIEGMQNLGLVKIGESGNKVVLSKIVNDCSFKTKMEIVEALEKCGIDAIVQMYAL
jgi:hypothetical protein